MTATPSSPPPPPGDPEKLARRRFTIIGLFRLSGAFIVAFGFLVILQKFSWVQGNKAKAMGGILVAVGLYQYVIVPRRLASLFRSRPPQ
ncbi:MAG: hypothetical protein ABW039_10640 [Sphingobium sp.]